MPEFTYGKPCHRCGGTLRYVGCRTCVACHRAKRQTWREGNRDADRANSARWAKNNREYNSARFRIWRVENPERKLQQMREWKLKNPEHVQSYSRAHYQAKRDSRPTR